MVTLPVIKYTAVIAVSRMGIGCSLPFFEEINHKQIWCLFFTVFYLDLNFHQSYEQKH